MRLIDADMLSHTMYHMAFEEDSDLQKRDSGCWIRYKLFEDVLKVQPTCDLVRCGECKNLDRDGSCLMYDVDSGYYPHEDDFCSQGERRANDE